MNVRMKMIRGTGFAALFIAATYGVAQADCYGPEVAFRSRTAVRYYSQCVNATTGRERAQNSLYEAESLDAAARKTGGEARARDVSRARAIVMRLLVGDAPGSIKVQARREEKRLAHLN
jgi:hypothetical protein